MTEQDPLAQHYLRQCQEPEGYLDFARFGPPTLGVQQAVQRLLSEAGTAGPGTVPRLMQQQQRAIDVLARLVGRSPEHLTLVPNTSSGLFYAAFNLPCGDVAVSAREFPANTYPWVRAEQAGIRDVRWMDTPGGVLTPQAVAAQLRPDTAIVALSAVDFRSGYAVDLAAMREAIGDRFLVVDAIQGFGAVDEPWDCADVVVAGGQKWLRAGWGTGFLALSDRVLERMRPLLSGWTGTQLGEAFDDRVHPPESAAHAWSLTHPSPFTAEAIAAAAELVEEAGVSRIAGRIADRVAELEEAVRDAGGTVVSSTRRRAGILAFEHPRLPRHDGDRLLAEHGITATAREGQIRLSPHASTTPAAAQRLRSALVQLP